MQQNPPAQLQQQLSSLTQTTWQHQLQIIESLPVNVQMVKLISHRNYSSDLASLLAAQNPRSKLVTTLTDYLVKLFDLHTNHLLSFANLLITSDCLLRLLASGNKVVATSANELIKCIVSNTDFKDKHKQVKYVKALEDEFLKSKNNYVREKISLYFLFIATSHHYSTKDDIRNFQRQIVKVGVEDACEKVRKNMKQILQNLVHFQKENVVLSAVAAKTAQKHGNSKHIRARQQGPRVIYSSVNHDSLLPTERQEVQLQQSKVQLCNERQQQPLQLNLNDYQFYLQRLNPKNAWSMVILSYQSLLQMINRNSLDIFNKDTLYIDTFSKLIPFLSQKRGKVYESCSEVFFRLIGAVTEGKKEKCITYLQQNIPQIVQQAVKVQSVAMQVLPQLVAINPTLVLVKMSQVSTQLKTHKQKLILLDSILQNIPTLIACCQTSKNSKKLTAITRMMCHHISTSSPREKDISLASLAIISELKSSYPEDVLTTLLCQSDKTLTKIIEIAESIDESLKAAVVGYINSLKGNSQSDKSFSTKATLNLSDKLNHEMRLVIQGKTQNITKIGELYLTNFQSLGQRQFKQLLRLLQYLPSSDMIMQYRFLLGEIAKNNSQSFIRSLIDVVSSLQKENQYHLLMYLEILALAARNIHCSLTEEESTPLTQQCCKCLIEIYRGSGSVKIRNASIEALTLFDPDSLEEHLNQKQLLLVKTYKQRLEDDDQRFNQMSF